MAWPLDARDFTFNEGIWVPSSTMNAIQDRIVDLHRSQSICFLAGHTDVDIGVDPSWKLDGTIVHGWECRNTNANLVIPVPLREGTANGAIIDAVRAKVFSTGAPTMQMDVYSATVNIGNPTTAPSLGASLGSDTAAGAGAWDTLAVTGLGLTIADDLRIMVVFSLATSGDNVAAVVVTYQPLTPT